MFAGPDRQRLVVIGNGMVGARFVEELIARGGDDRYEIVMFGDEPHGNYNRILLSGILAGSHEAEDTFINPLEWYEANGITLHSGVRVDGGGPRGEARAWRHRRARAVRRARDSRRAAARSCRRSRG